MRAHDSQQTDAQSERSHARAYGGAPRVGGRGVMVYEDQRPEAATLEELQRLADSSPQAVAQLRLQELASGRQNHLSPVVQRWTPKDDLPGLTETTAAIRALDAERPHEYQEDRHEQFTRAGALVKEAKAVALSAEWKDALDALVKKFRGGKLTTWNEDYVSGARALEAAQSSLLAQAEAIQGTPKGVRNLDQQLTAASTATATTTTTTPTVATKSVPVVRYESINENHIGLWLGLLKQLRTPSTRIDTIHEIVFAAPDRPITVTLSQHRLVETPPGGSEKESPDYMVRDARAALFYDHKVRQGADAEGKHEAKDLSVSYAAFGRRLHAMKGTVDASDSDVARWMLLIIEEPLTAPEKIAGECRLDSDGLQLLFELVATWMLAEPVRHKSAMLSGIVELRLIMSGSQTFQDSLGARHPMQHQGSGQHGRKAERHEEILRDSEDPNPEMGAERLTKVTRKQVAALGRFGGGTPNVSYAAVLAPLVDGYITAMKTAQQASQPQGQ